MSASHSNGRGRWHRRIQMGFLVWAAVSTLWLANSVRTRDVDPALLTDDARVRVVDDGDTLTFEPLQASDAPALVFFCGAGIGAEAYAPLLRPIADAGYPVIVVRLPLRFAPLERHKQGALQRASNAMARRTAIRAWVVSGHSLGGALAARYAAGEGAAVAGLVLVGTTHPKSQDLSALSMPVTKVLASLDGVAPVAKVRANLALLPAHTRLVEIPGGNHSQFGRYGHQLFDGDATVPRARQEQLTRAALIDMLEALPIPAPDGDRPTPEEAPASAISP